MLFSWFLFLFLELHHIAGMFIGDEIIPGHRTRDPSRGSELCGVVEAMFSYNVMFSIHGDVAFADRVERIAYNALPGIGAVVEWS